MNLPATPFTYSPTNEAALREELKLQDARNLKRGGAIEQPRLILKDTVTGDRYQVTIASGVLTLVAA
jgi:hypothetical protein